MGQGRRHLSVGHRIVRGPGRRHLLTCTALASGLALAAFFHAGPAQADDNEGGNGSGTGAATSSDSGFILNVPGDTSIGFINRSTNPATSGDAGPGEPGLATDGADGAAGSPGVPALPGVSAQGLGGMGGDAGLAKGGSTPIDVDVGGSIISATTILLSGGDISQGAGDATGGAGGAGGAGTGAQGGQGGAGGGGGGNVTNSILPALAFVSGIPGAAGGAANAQGGNAGTGGQATGGSAGPIDIDVGVDIIGGLTISATGGVGTGGEGRSGGAATGGTGGDGGDAGNQPFNNPGTVTTSAIAGNLTFASGGAGGAGGSAHAIGGQGGNAGDGSGGALGSVTIDVGGNITGGFAFDGTGGAGTGRHAGDGGAATAGSGGDGGTGGGGGGTLTDTNVGGNVTFGTGGAGGAGGSADATGGNGGEGGDGTGGGLSAFSLIVGGNASIAAGIAIDISAEGGAGTGGAGGAGGAATATSGGDGGAGGGGGGAVVGNSFVGAADFGDGAVGGSGGSANATAGDGGDGGEGVGGAIGAVTLIVAGQIDHPVDIILTAGGATGGKGGAGGEAQAGTAGAGGAAGGGQGTVGAGSTIDNGVVVGTAALGGAGGNANATGGAGGEGGDALGGTLGAIDLEFTGATIAAVSLETLGGKATGGEGGAGGAAHAGKAGQGSTSGSTTALAGLGGAGGDGVGGDLAGVTLSLGSNTTATGILSINVLGDDGQGGTGGKGGDASSPDADPGQAGGDVTAGAGGAGGVGHGGAIGPIVVNADGTIAQELEVIARGGIGRGGTGGAGGAADAGNGGNGLPGAGAGGAGGHGGSATSGAGGDGGDATGGDVTVDLAASGSNIGGNTLFNIGATGGDAFGGTGGASAQAMAGSGGAGSAGANGGTGQAGFAGGAGGDGGDATGGNGGAGGDATGGTASVKVVNDGTYFSAGPVFNITATGGVATAGAGGEGGAANGIVSGDGGAGGEGGNGGDSGNGGAGGDAGSGGAATAGDGGKGGDAQGGDAIVDVTNNGTIQSADSAIVIQATGGGATAGNGGAGGLARGNSNANGGAGGDGMPAGGVGGTGGAQGSRGDVLGGSSIGGNATGGNADVTVANKGTILAAGDGIQITTELGPATAGGATLGPAVSTGTSQPGAGGNPGGSQGPFDDGGSITAGGNETPGLAELGTSTVIVKNAGTMDVDGAAVRVNTLSANTSVLVDNSGTMQGGLAGVAVVGADSGPLNQVKVANSGFLSADTLRAVDVKDAIAHVVNTGTLKGFVDFDLSGGNVIDNTAGGVFEARLNSRFGFGDVINNRGLIHTAEDPNAAEQVEFQNLAALNNKGVISLVDGGADTVDTLFVTNNTAYNSVGGVLAVDAFLAPEADGGKSDKLEVIGGSSGVTTVVVNLTNPNGSTPNTDGIPLAFIPGFTQAGDFVPEGGVINAGFFAWDIKLSSVDHRTHLLYTTGLGSGAYEFAAGITGAQDIWQQTVGSLLQRQADLRALIGNALVTPVADFAEPVEPTAVSRVTPGLWARVAGSHIERDGDAPDPLSTDREQDIWGFFAGFDFGAENVRAQGDALLFGLLGGYTTSDLDFDQTGDEWDFEGPSIGAYATYVDHQFFIDAIVKADFLSIDIDADNIAPGGGDADTDAVNIGGQIDTGYKLLFDMGMFVEPQASLAVVHTEIDDIDDIFGGAVEFDDETRASGRLGLRLGYETTTSGGTAYSGDVTASVWQIFTGDNDVTVEAPLWPSTNLSDDPGETYGDVSLGLSMLSPDGWSGFLRGNYLFAEDYEAITGNVGVRLAW